MSRQIVTRFAPSPTGMLHIGGVRTALFCWLFARKHGGRFILRIEDTDLSRSTDDNIRIIEEGMAWCGLDWDEGPVVGDASQWKGPHGPYRQMQRMDLYKAKIQELLDKNLAYRCRCSREAIEERRKTVEAAGKVFQYNRGLDAGKGCAAAHHDASQPAAIRFRMPESGDIVVPDLIKGDTRFPADSLDDWIIARTGDGPGEIGVPTYNFCVVVDDTHMQVTHVIRGDDHLNNTPKQIPLFAAFGYDLPAFAHVPMILGADGAKLSKRHGATSITEYQAMGLLPSAVRLALARLSWTPKIDGKAVESAEEELLTDEQMIQLFDLADCQKSAARFDMDKLQWLNQKLIQRSTWQELEPHLRPFVMEVSKGAWEAKSDVWKAQAIQCTQKGKSLTDMAEALRFAFERPAAFDEKAVEKFMTPVAKLALRDLAGLTDYSHEGLEAGFNAILERHGLKTKDLAQALRVALCGKPVSPGIYDTLMLVGRDEVLARLERWL
ncbi:glutamate--tRNA ligase [Geothrix limicola]|uniref:Glutamate--tRNA ligase n=1 Tax=Geothrix limicola TaxID=2927978 RepID=A0ABQ5QKW4_9BACT|nr:glutamate--tRNA ligase [Geothrix limicola]GLH74946.1 glutamate--tRNA ligase [Geothrix limicola]